MFCYMKDKPWVFGHLIQLQRRLGRDNFPIIEQTLYPDHREMVSLFPSTHLFNCALFAHRQTLLGDGKHMPCNEIKRKVDK